MASIEIRDVNKIFGATHVLHDVDLDVANGEFLVLVGPSGCGKSTLLRMIAGLEDVTAGEIAIGGRVVTDLPPKERDIAMVFQNYALYPHMTVRENMAFSLKLHGVDKPTIAKAGRGSGRDPQPDALSRSLPATALPAGRGSASRWGGRSCANPQVFLFDEPLSNLDAKLRVQMRVEIKALHHRLKATSVYVTHDQIEAMTMADRIVVLNEGRVEQIGSPLELYDHPANLFVAGFIGSPAMNFLKGKLRRFDDGVFVETSGYRMPVVGGADGQDGLDVVYCFRPGASAHRRAPRRACRRRSSSSSRPAPTRTFTAISAARRSAACSASASTTNRATSCG